MKSYSESTFSEEGGKKYLLLEEQESQRNLNKKEEMRHCQKPYKNLTKHQHYQVN